MRRLGGVIGLLLPLGLAACLARAEAGGSVWAGDYRGVVLRQQALAGQLRIDGQGEVRGLYSRGAGASCEFQGRIQAEGADFVLTLSFGPRCDYAGQTLAGRLSAATAARHVVEVVLKTASGGDALVFYFPRQE